MQAAQPQAMATATVVRPIVSIQAAIVSLNTSNMSQIVYQELRTVSGSKEAEAYCKSLDAANGNTYSAISYYIVTYQAPVGGEGGFGNVYQYTPNTFKKQIEPLYPPVVWPPVT